MSNSILVKRSAVPSKIPETTDLNLGEFAMNTYDGKVFIKKNDGAESIVTLATVNDNFEMVWNETTSSIDFNFL